MVMMVTLMRSFMRASNFNKNDAVRNATGLHGSLGKVDKPEDLPAFFKKLESAVRKFIKKVSDQKLGQALPRAQQMHACWSTPAP